MTVIDSSAPTPEELAAKQQAIVEDRKKFLELQEEIYKRWKNNTSSLEEFPDHQAQVAMILDNQHVFNQGQEEWFAKNALELTTKILKGFVGFDLVSVQPMMYGPSSKIYYFEFKYTKRPEINQDGGIDHKEFSEFYTKDNSDLPDISLHLSDREVKSQTKKLSPVYKGEMENTEGYLNDLADEIRDKISREITTDIRNNAGTVMKRIVKEENFDYEGIYVNIVEMSSVIHRKTLRGGANWLVMSPKMAKKFPSHCWNKDPDDVKHVTRVGTINSRWKLIVDPLYPENEILVGYREDMFNGYVYSPYIMLGLTPVVLDPDTFCPRRGFLTRYAKCLLSPKGYGKIQYEIDNEKTEAKAVSSAPDTREGEEKAEAIEASKTTYRVSCACHCHE